MKSSRNLGRADEGGVMRLPWGSAVTYTLTNILSAAVPFFLIPILTRYLSPTDYGIAVTFQVLVALVAPFTGLSIYGAVARMYYEKEIDLPVYIGNCFLILGASTLLVGLLLWSVILPLSRMAHLPPVMLWLVVLVAVGQYISLVLLTLWQVRGYSFHYGVLKTSLALVTAFLSLWLVVGRHLAWQGIVLAQAIAGALSGLAAIYILWASGWLKFRYHYSYIKSALRFGLPLIPHTLGGWLIMSADRLLLDRMIGTAATGIYSIAFQVTLVITMLQVSFNTAWTPWLYERLEKKDPATSKQIVHFTYLYAAGMILCSLAFAYMAPWCLHVFVGRSFESAGRFIYWIAPAKGLEAMYYMTCNYIFYSTKTFYIACATFVSSFVHLLAAYLLIRSVGAIGAAVATLISSIVLVGQVWWFAERTHKMPWFGSSSSIKEMTVG